MSRDKLNLVYWSEDNFGDALSPLLVQELSGGPTQLKHAYKSKFRRFVKGILYLSLREIQTVLFPWERNLLGVGSVICCGNARSDVWGSGFMSNSGVFKGGKLYAVRGPYTSARLVEQGFPECSVYGDPALLLPLWMPAAKQAKYRLGIVPHWKETEDFKRLYGDRFKIIDLRTKDVAKVVDEITSCDYILSTSLHGLIVAHAYQIPALWIKKGFIETDGFKFSDYFKSVGIAEYDGLQDIDQILSSAQQCKATFRDHRDKSLIGKSLEDLQRGLLQAAPFPLTGKYRQFMEGRTS